MADFCRLSPVVFRRKGTKIEEVDSKLYQDIKKAVKDSDTAWEMWSYTKTSHFKKKYKNVEYDELGEVTLPSLIKVLGLEDAYNSQKDVNQVSRDYGFTNTVFKSSEEAISKMNDFNSTEKKFIAAMTKKGDGYVIDVAMRTPTVVEKARQQSYNYALTGEIIDLLRSIGFDVGFVSDPKFTGIFDPTNAKLNNGLLEVIRIAKGEKGEEALPEEFSHLMIEGLSGHPLVVRLLDSIDSDTIEEVLGDDYNKYYDEYEGNIYKLKREVAGKLLAEHIRKQGTIRKSVVAKRRGLLSRIWEWAKRMFSKITRQQLEEAMINAHDAVADIYNLISSGEEIPLISKSKILSSEEFYKLSSKYDTLESIAAWGMSTTARMAQRERRTSKLGKMEKDTADALKNIQYLYEEEENYYGSLKIFLDDAVNKMRALWNEKRIIERDQDNLYTSGIEEINRIAQVVRKIDEFIAGYEPILNKVASFQEDDAYLKLKSSDLTEKGREILLASVTTAKKFLNSLKEFKHDATFNIVYYMARTVYKEDKAIGIGSKRNEMMSLHAIIEHAERDINFVDSLFSAMYDCDDSLLSIIDSLVKNQQYERDMEMAEINAEISLLDKKLTDAGYTSDFMYEKDEKGVPTGRIISIYDWVGYNEALKKKKEELRARGLEGPKYSEELYKWKYNEISKTGQKRVIRLYLNPEDQAMYERGENPTSDLYEEVPNPKIFSKNVDLIENLPTAQKEYYKAVMKIKADMMSRIPKRGQYLFRTVNISKDLIEGIMDNSTGNRLKATLDYYRRKFVRRPDDIGFGMTDTFSSDLKDILKKKKDPKETAEEIIKAVQDETDDDITALIDKKELTSIIRRYKEDINNGNYNKVIEEIQECIASANFYVVETDFAGHRVQRLPIYYSRRLKDMRMLSTDFSGTLTAYCAMAVNYDKMSKIADIIEVTRTYVNEEREVRELEENRPMISRYRVFGKVYKNYVTRAGSQTNIGKRLDDYIDANFYEERTEDMGTFEFAGVDYDINKILDTLKDYTGILGLGFNLFSSISNIAVGKIQQWIEAYAGEYFTMADYAKAVKQYGELIIGCLAEIGSPIKKNKLSLLIQMFDPMGDFFENLRESHHSKNVMSRIFGNNALGYIGMNAGEHILHCQTMLAILNHQKLVDINTGEKISLFDALEVVTDEKGITKLQLKENLSYERDLIDHTGTQKTNKNYGKALRDENGKIKTEQVPLKQGENAYTQYIIRIKKMVRGVNDSLNGAFSATDKGAAHRMALWRLILQFRQWMPAHYMRRFARAHYDSNLEQWREGYYTTVYKIQRDLMKGLIHSKWEYAKIQASLSEHEKANVRRAQAEIGMFLMLWTLCKLGGRVRDRDRSWLDKMALYQIHRMFLELGASAPCPQMLSNMIQIMQSPAATISTFEKLERLVHLDNLFDEIQTGRFQGWTEFERDVFNLLPYIPQLFKAWYFDDSMFSMYEKD